MHAEPATASSASPQAADGPSLARWMAWRRRCLVAVALLACLGLFMLVRWLAAAPSLDAQWAAGPQGQLVLLSSAEPVLQGLQGQALKSIASDEGDALPVDALLLHRTPRWQVTDSVRLDQVSQHEALSRHLASGRLELVFSQGAMISLVPDPRGVTGLGWMFWPLAAVALLLVLAAAVVGVERPTARNALYALMACCQAANLLLTAVATARGLGLPPGLAAADMELRLALDVVTAASIAHAVALMPPRTQRSSALAWIAWIAAAGVLWGVHVGLLSPVWWWAQALCLALGLLAVLLLSPPLRAPGDTRAAILRRLSMITLATLALMTAGVAVSAGQAERAHAVAVGASVAWYLFGAFLLLLMPFLARSRLLQRELALLAAVSSVAAAVDLLFVSAFSFEPFGSLAVAVFVALALYAGARQYMVDRLLGTHLLTTERTFELLFRAARDVQAQPDRYAQCLARLLRDLFDPLELVRSDRVPSRTRVLGGGSALAVPVRNSGTESEPSISMVMRSAQRGQRLFTHEDARLADRMVEQLHRAVAHDQAVEQGRFEERQRIAQDLHDDIGARLLTMMYQAPTPEMEDYIRHTLQDLKTLTRGLAAADHRLSHAAAEWKTDLNQRLSAAQAQLGWSLSVDHDLKLSVVQWSALTRLLRELVSNALFHGNASRIDVALQLQGPLLTMSVADDGQGRDPQSWRHGLGMGGVRKRVKLLGGSVAWRENEPRGILCEVRIEGFNLVSD